MSGVVTRIVRSTGSALHSGLALIGCATSVVAFLEFRKVFPPKEKEAVNKEKNKNRVLVIPFHLMNLVEQQQDRPELLSLLESDDDESSATRVQSYQVRELVDVLHKAASDPSITAVYGIFGHGGGGLEEAGWAQLEEVRNALRVIQESHRRHAEPNIGGGKNNSSEAASLPKAKPLYAYTDSFSSFSSPSNKDYYMASVFTHIHLQEKGELNLFGMMAQQFFLRSLLEKYNIQLHVFKNGLYKNAPDMFTNLSYNKFHLENVTNIQTSINHNVCKDIANSRWQALAAASSFFTPPGQNVIQQQTSSSWWSSKKQHKQTAERAFDESVESLWTRIYNFGTFSPESAHQAGLVDYLPRRDPLTELIDRKTAIVAPTSSSSPSSGDDESGGRMEDADPVPWKAHETSVDNFPADSVVSLKDYSKQIAKKKKKAERRQYWRDFLTQNSFVARVWLTNAVTSSQKPKESIALLQVNGTIGDEMANKLVCSIRKIRKDDETKCVVMRVSSPGGSIQACETIQQELKSLKVPIVVSFGNVSASGGYYISAAAERIFVSEKTITGSIGVFGIRMDLTGLAAMYGINVDHVPTGEFSGSYSAFYPMSQRMKENMAAQIDGHYAHFKQIVANGRRIPLDQVEAIAQGRVWTGDQAKVIGLVDEVGGLHRALAYARRSYTTNDENGDGSDVVIWPKKKTWTETLSGAADMRDGASILAAFIEWMVGGELDIPHSTATAQSRPSIPASPSGMIDWILKSPYGIPGTLSGSVMTIDENSAIQCLLENSR